MDTLLVRRSVRTYLDRAVEEEKIEKMLRAAMAAPSAGNQQPWEFIVVQDKDRLEELSKASPYAGPVKRAPLAIIVLANTSKLKYADFWHQDLAAATENLMLEAVEQGLGSVWIGISPEKYRMEHIAQMYSLPESVKPFCIVAIGYPENPDANHPADRFDESRIHYETY